MAAVVSIKFETTGDLDFGTASLLVNGEKITVPDNSSVTAANVTLTAANTAPRDFDPSILTNDIISALGLSGLSSPADLLTFDPSSIDPATIVDLPNRIAAANPASYLGSIANVTVQGNLTASGDISISAEATNQTGLTAPIGDNLLMFRFTEATALVQDATLTASGNVSVTANNHGDRGSLNSTNNVVLSIAVDRSSATVDGATITGNGGTGATGLTVTATSDANYSVQGSKAIELIDSFTTAAIRNASHVQVLSGGVQLSATESSKIETASSGNGGIAAAVSSSIKTLTPT